MDIRIRIDFTDHDKTDDLCAKVGDSAIRCLLRLWSWAAQTRPKGILDGKTSDDIERKAKWTGERGAFVTALIQTGFLDVLPGEVLALHDWEEHQGWVVGFPERQKQAKKAIAARWAKRGVTVRITASNKAVDNTDTGSNTGSTSTGNTPLLSSPPLSFPLQQTTLPAKKLTLTDMAMEVYNHHPKKVGRPQSLTYIGKRLEALKTYEERLLERDKLIALVEAYKVSDRVREGYVMDASTFFHTHMDDDINGWKQEPIRSDRKAGSTAYHNPGYADEIAAVIAANGAKRAAEEAVSVGNGSGQDENFTPPY